MPAIALLKIRSDFTARKIRGLSIFFVVLSNGEKKVLGWKGNAARLSNDAANQPSSPSSLVLPLDYPKKAIAFPIRRMNGDNSTNPKKAIAFPPLPIATETRENLEQSTSLSPLPSSHENELQP